MAKKIILCLAAAAGFVFFSIEFLHYFATQYQPFIAHDFDWDTYLPSALRFTCRIGYPVGLVGILLFRRWGAALLLLAWLAQLLPSAIFFLYTTHHFYSEHYASLLELAIAALLLYWCRDLLSGDVVRPVLLFALLALLLHTGLYLSVHYGSII